MQRVPAGVPLSFEVSFPTGLFVGFTLIDDSGSTPVPVAGSVNGLFPGVEVLPGIYRFKAVLQPSKSYLIKKAVYTDATLVTQDVNNYPSFGSEAVYADALEGSISGIVGSAAAIQAAAQTLTRTNLTAYVADDGLVPAGANTPIVVLQGAHKTLTFTLMSLATNQPYDLTNCSMLRFCIADDAGADAFELFYLSQTVATMTSGQAQISGIDTTNMSVGMPAFGPGIPIGTTILTINTASSAPGQQDGIITLSKNITANGMTVALTFGQVSIQSPAILGTLTVKLVEANTNALSPVDQPVTDPTTYGSGNIYGVVPDLTQPDGIFSFNVPLTNLFNVIAANC